MRSIGIPPAQPPREGFGAGLGDFARQLWWERRLRARFFPAELFAEPAWDLILHLFASEAEGQKVRRNKIHLGASVPPSTALARVQALEALGIVGEDPAAPGARPRRIALTPLARGRLEHLLVEMLVQRDLRRDKAGAADTGGIERILATLIACRAELDPLGGTEAGAHLARAIEAVARTAAKSGRGP